MLYHIDPLFEMTVRARLPSAARPVTDFYMPTNSDLAPGKYFGGPVPPAAAPAPMSRYPTTLACIPKQFFGQVFVLSLSCTIRPVVYDQNAY